jgi:uncharacterized protein YndB with AHSA1/START domain
MAVPFIRDNKTTLRVPINAPLDAVWELLTTSAGLSRWLPVACRGELEAGAEFDMVWSENPTVNDITSHRITLWEPTRRFGFTWPAVMLDFEVSRQNNMSVLKLACTYSARDAFADLQTEELVGWTVHLLTLKSVAEGGPDLRTPGKVFSWDKGFISGI